jgi:hypothetical protein
MSKLDPKDFRIFKENKKDFKQTVIARDNLTNKFSIGELEKDLEKLEDLEKQMSAQVRLSTAAVGNVERNHPFVAKLSAEQLATAAYVHETKQTLQAAERKLKEIKNTKKQYKDVMSLLNTKFGFDKLAKKDESAK